VIAAEGFHVSTLNLYSVVELFVVLLGKELAKF